MASYLPQSLIDSINANSKSNQPLIIVIKVFYNDKFFLNTNDTILKLESKAISVSLPGQDKILPEDIPILFKKHSQDASNENVCSYWAFHPSSERGWAQKGCKLNPVFKNESVLIVCSCEHLSHFGYLTNSGSSIKREYMTESEKMHDRILDVISRIGGTLSIMGKILTKLKLIKFKYLKVIFFRNIGNVCYRPN